MISEQLNVHITYKRKKHHSDALLLQLYRALLLPRMIEEKMLNQLRMNKISKWFSGIGQEAIAVGVTEALQPDEYILPMHRNLGVFTSRHIPFHQLFKQWQGTLGGFTKGRDRSFHFGTNEYHIVGMISHLGPQLAVGSGIALADKLLKTNKVTVAFTGEGATSEGDFHEALNVAAVWKLPIIFVIENNGYGLSTPTNEQYACKHLVDRAAGYGIEGIQIDGNNILEVYDTIQQTAAKLRKDPRPVLIEALTFRMRGHEEASGVDYVPKEYFDTWERKDPLTNFEHYLHNIGLLNDESIATIRAEFKHYIDRDLKLGFAEPPATATVEQELGDVYAPYTQSETAPRLSASNQKRFIEAISDGLRQGMEQHDNMVIMGQDIAEYGGAFKITKGFVELFGRERVRNTPICESAIVGIGLGLSIKKMKSVVEMQFADFVTCAFNQIVNNLAKSHWRWGQNADVVVRMPTGAGTGAGPFHSQSNEAWFFHTPGLKIVYPSNPYDAKGLLLAAIADPNPVLYFEHKALYRSLVAEVPDAYYTVPIGKAQVVQSGDDVSIITYGMGVHWAKKVLATLPDISAEVLDLRSLLPLDTEAIVATAKKTAKVLILHEDNQTGGIGGEIAAIIAEHCFQYLDAPIVRCGALDTPIPFALPLEQQYLPEARFKAALQQLVAF